MRMLVAPIIVGLVLLYYAKVWADAYGHTTEPYIIALAWFVLLLIGSITTSLLRTRFEKPLSRTLLVVTLAIGMLSAPAVAVFFADIADDAFIIVNNSTDKHIKVEAGLLVHRESYFKEFELSPGESNWLLSPAEGLMVCSNVISCYRVWRPSCEARFGCDDPTYSEFIEVRGEVTSRTYRH